MNNHINSLRVVLDGFRYFRRTLGWKQAIQLVLAQRASKPHLRIRLPHTEDKILLRPNTTDVHIFGKVWVEKEYSLPFSNENPKFIIDAGANTGLASLYFSREFPKAQILAIEPENSNYEVLTQNCSPFPRIRLLKAALWSSSTMLGIVNPDAESCAFHVAELGANPGECDDSAIRGVSVPELLAEYGHETIDILKLDIEGSERQLFGPGCAEWLPRVRMIIIELHDRFHAGCSRAFYSQLTAFPFHQEQRGENLFVLLRESENFSSGVGELR